MATNSFTGYSDPDLLTRMAQGDERAFTELYERHWKIIFGYAYNRLRDKEKCRSIVQDIFMSLWERRSVLRVNSLRDYLFRAVKYTVLDTMNEDEKREEYAKRFFSMYPEGQLDDTLQEQENLEDLKVNIDRSLAHLPEYYGKAFRLSRLENLTSAEIAKRMNISVRTAENYITVALKHLRGSLGEMMMVVWLVITGW